MEIVPLIFTAISTISIAVVIVLVLQLKKTLNATITEQEKLLKFVEAANELNKEQYQITAEARKKEIESFENVKNQFASIIEGSSDLENRLVEVLEVNNNSRESLSLLVQNNAEVQLTKLQALANQLQIITPVSSQVENLIQGNLSLENRFTNSQEANRPKSKGFKKSTLGID